MKYNFFESKIKYANIKTEKEIKRDHKIGTHIKFCKQW